jgi:hypothetical protein
MTNLSPDVISLFQQADAAAYGSIDPTTTSGSQGEWPPEGTHECIVTGLEIEKGEFRTDGNNKVPSIVARFCYELLPAETEDPDGTKFFGMSSPHWKGKDFNMVLGAQANSIPDTATRSYQGRESVTRPREMNSKNIARFKGHLTKLLGITADELSANPFDDVQTLIQRINGATKLVARVECSYFTPPGSNNPFRTDYIKELVSL